MKLSSILFFSSLSFLEYDIYRDTKCSFFCWSFSAEQTKSVMKCSSVNSFSAPFCTLLGFLFAFLQSFFHHSVASAAAPHLTAVAAAFVYICIKSKDISLNTENPKSQSRGSTLSKMQGA